MITVEMGISYGGWSNCCRVANEEIDLVVTGDVGPRVIRLGFLDQPNEFCEVEETLGLTGGDSWRLYGGHRLWHAPEEAPRTYYPDNSPVQLQPLADGVVVTQEVESTTGIQKEMEIRLAAEQARVIVTHRLRNRGAWPVPLAPWALTVMAAGGVGILSLPAGGSHEENLQPDNALTLWAYTDLADPRWGFGTDYILLRQDPQLTTPQKIGAHRYGGWLGYARRGHLFGKTGHHAPGAGYPDRGSMVELFTNGFMLELETLGPLRPIAPDSTVEHVEEWFLLDNVAVPDSPAAVAEQIAPRVAELLT
jgi:hypothetical protein